ncbi:MAG: TMEM175 family protein [Trebonia sp.]
MTAPPHESQGHHPFFASADTAADDPEVEARAADRVVVFSDAVVAIAITLLALDLPVPPSTHTWTNAQFWHSLTSTGGEYFAFLLSFVIIGGNWAGHRRTFRYVNRLNHQVGYLNMLWLLMMILTPFAARLLALDGGFGVRFAIYTLVQVIASACLLQTNRQIVSKELLRPDAPARARHPDSSHTIALIVVFLLSIPLAFVLGSWTFALWAAVPVLSQVLRRRRLAGGRHATS